VPPSATSFSSATASYVPDLGLRPIEDLESLGLVCLGGGEDLLAGEARARVVPARQITDHGRGVTHEEDDGMPELTLCGKHAPETLPDRRGQAQAARGRAGRPVDQKGKALRLTSERRSVSYSSSSSSSRSSSSSSSSLPVMAKARLLLTSSFSSLPTLKKGKRLAGTGTG
jgi:hypothetical protein